MKADEALWLWMSERLLPVAGGGAPSSQSVEARLSALPLETRNEMSEALKRICLDETPTRTHERPEVPVEPILRQVLRAMTYQRPLAIVYRSQDGAVSERRVEPQGLLLRPPLWYVLSYDRSRDAGRTFRMDRIESLTPMLGTFRFRDLDTLFDTKTLRPFQ